MGNTIAAFEAWVDIDALPRAPDISGTTRTKGNVISMIESGDAEIDARSDTRSVASDYPFNDDFSKFTEDDWKALDQVERRDEREVEDLIPTAPPSPRPSARPGLSQALSATSSFNSEITLIDSVLASDPSNTFGLTKYAGPPDGLIYIAHDEQLQGLLDHREISWAAQYEIARMHANHQRPLSEFKIPERLDQLASFTRGSNRQAVMVAHIFPPLADESSSNAIPRRTFPDSVYRELDKEHAAMLEDQSAGLGSGLSSDDDFYGGKVEQRGTLVALNASTGTQGREISQCYEIRLERHRIGRSTRIARRLGSRRLIQVSIPKQLTKGSSHRLVEYFCQRFVICGRVFQAFYAHESRVYLLETGSFQRAPERLDMISPPMSLSEFIQWHNPPEARHPNNTRLNNMNQGMAKYSSRFKLCLSDSVPTFHVADNYLKVIDDIVSPAHTNNGKPPAELTMTDGCGFFNDFASRQLPQKFWNNGEPPSAIQGRICGAKGMFLRHPTNKEAVPRVWIRLSQNKIYVTVPDPSQLVLDLIRKPILTTPASISAEPIVNLSHNRVPTATFVDLARAELDEVVRQLTDWSGDKAMLRLYRAVCESQGVTATRLQRDAAGAARSLGLASYITESSSVEEEPASDDLSGYPSSIAETVMLMLLNGFNPETSVLLMQDIKQILKSTIDVFINRYRLNVPLSLTAFAIPDPTGLLEEGQIYCRSSDHKWPDKYGDLHDVLQGDVLVTRAPCKVPSDIQKMVAVEPYDPKALLRKYKNIVLFSCKGARSPMSLLGGGDYDGDTVTVIWEPKIVDPFENAPIKFADPPPNFIKENFHEQKETVAAFVEKHESLTDEERSEVMQRDYLLSALDDQGLVGRYSKWHDIAVYCKGYDHPETVRLAYMFCTCLDGSKSGRTVKKEVLMRDQSKLNSYASPNWKETGSQDESNTSTTNRGRTPVRPPNSPEFVMDTLKAFGESEKIRHLRNFDDLQRKAGDPGPDSDLLKPFLDANSKAEELAKAGNNAMRDELAVIKRIVADCRKSHQLNLRKGNNTTLLPSTKKQGKSYQEVVTQTAHEFWARLSLGSADGDSRRDYMFFWDANLRASVAASYAYHHDMQGGKDGGVYYDGTRFPWSIAFRELCRIKAQATGAYSTSIKEFAEAMVVHKKFAPIPERELELF